MDHVSSNLLPHRQPAAREHRKHRPICGKHVSVEPCQTLAVGDSHQVTQQAPCDTLSLIILFNGKRHLGTRPRSRFGVAHVPSSPNDDFRPARTDSSPERNNLIEVHVCGQLQLGFGQFLSVTEEARVNRRPLKLTESSTQPLFVIWPNGSYQY